MKYTWSIPVSESAPVVRVKIFGSDDRPGRKDCIFKNMDAYLVESDDKTYLALHKTNRDIIQSHLIFILGSCIVVNNEKLYKYTSVSYTTNPVLEVKEVL